MYHPHARDAATEALVCAPLLPSQRAQVIFNAHIHPKDVFNPTPPEYVCGRARLITRSTHLNKGLSPCVI